MSHDQLPEEPLYGNEDWQQIMDEEHRRAEEEAKREAAWAAHFAYIRNMFASPARGYSSGNVYEETGPAYMGSDGKLHREQRWK